MSDDPILTVNADLRVPRAELDYRASRSGGPGGQHVNTTSSRVELLWDLEGSPSLTGEQRARLREKLANRIDGEGVLHLTASEHRSQHQNREAVTERFVEMVRRALVVPKARKKTRPPRASREARLQTKKRRSEVKRMRRGVSGDE
ncbi:MAG: aminoacyl-tRNA hydrolase [Gemmatimonadota bacterium]|nr:aminoacyl-tRNA hydrolase [Gemmatimonadota bacterium]